MEAVYEFLKSKGYMTIDKFVGWLKDAKVIDGIKVQEEKIRKMFGKAESKANVSYDKFKEVVTQCAQDSGKGIDEVTKNLTDHVQTKAADGVKDAVSGAASTAKSTLQNLFK